MTTFLKRVESAKNDRIENKCLNAVSEKEKKVYNVLNI